MAARRTAGSTGRDSKVRSRAGEAQEAQAPAEEGGMAFVDVLTLLTTVLLVVARKRRRVDAYLKNIPVPKCAPRTLSIIANASFNVLPPLSSRCMAAANCARLASWKAGNLQRNRRRSEGIPMAQASRPKTIPKTTGAAQRFNMAWKCSACSVWPGRDPE